MSGARDYAIGALVSLALHAALALLVPREPVAPLAAARADAAPRFEVVALDAEAVRAILEPAPPPALPRLVDAPLPAEPSPAPAWPEASGTPTPPAPLAPTSAVVGLPDPAPGLPLVGPTERLTPFRPIEVVAAPPTPETSESPEAAPEAAGDPSADAEAVAPPASPSTLPSLEDVAELLAYRTRVPYPERARRIGLQGTVSVGLEIRTDGTVARTWILQSSGSSILDRAARAALERWRFDMDAVRATGLGRSFRQDVRFRFR